MSEQEQEQQEQTPGQIVDQLVTEYVKENGKSPFIKIDMEGDNGQLMVDMDQKFEELLVKTFKDSEPALSEYFTILIQKMMDNPEMMDELEEKISEPEDQEEKE